jgi:[acyl-carrier-protein] S-malonyltransferase
MGRDVFDRLPAARSVYDEADTLLGFSLTSLCFNGPERALNETVNTQAAIFVTSAALWRAIEPLVGEQTRVLAGHSVGQYGALFAAGSLDLAAGLHLVRERGRLMKEAGERNPGGMAAILGLEAPQAQVICEQVATATGQSVQVANDNSPGQVVISGTEEALARAMEQAMAIGAKKAVRLTVSIAAHSTLMSPVIDPFRLAVQAAPLRVPERPVVSNVSARPLERVRDVAEDLVVQLISPVRWSDSMRWILAQDIYGFVEVGPGRVLTGLLKRIDRGARHWNIADANDVLSLAERLA